MCGLRMLFKGVLLSSAVAHPLSPRLHRDRGLWRDSLRKFYQSYFINKAISLKKLARPAVALAKAGGERGIRTLVPGFPGSCLAGKRFRPLSHLSILADLIGSFLGKSIITNTFQLLSTKKRIKDLSFYASLISIISNKV